MQEAKAAAAASSSKKNIKLFKVGHKIPAKRLLTFKRDEDLTFTVQYDGEIPKGNSLLPPLLSRATASPLSRPLCAQVSMFDSFFPLQGVVPGPDVCMVGTGRNFFRALTMQGMHPDLCHVSLFA